MRRSVHTTFAAAAILGVTAAAPAAARGGCLWDQSAPRRSAVWFPTWTAVVGVSPTDAWLFGNSPSAMEHWDGFSWSGRGLTRSNRPRRMRPQPMTSGRSGSTPQPRPWTRCTYDGSSWTERPMVNPPGFTRLTTVSAISPTVAYAGGMFSPEHGRQVSAIERWDGSAWVHAPRAPAFAVTDLAAISRHDIWAVLEYPKDRISSTALAHWDGHSWTIVRPYPAGDFVTLLGVSARQRDDVWAVGGTPTAPVTYHYDGVSWTQIPVPPLTRTLRAAGLSERGQAGRDDRRRQQLEQAADRPIRARRLAHRAQLDPAVRVSATSPASPDRPRHGQSEGATVAHRRMLTLDTGRGRSWPAFQGSAWRLSHLPRASSCSPDLDCVTPRRIRWQSTGLVTDLVTA